MSQRKSAQSALKVKKNREICKIRAFDFLNCENMCDLTNIQASIYDRKIDARKIQSLLKDRNAPIWRNGNGRVKGKNSFKAMQTVPTRSLFFYFCSQAVFIHVQFKFLVII